jgi:hypothetical protein
MYLALSVLVKREIQILVEYVLDAEHDCLDPTPGVTVLARLGRWKDGVSQSRHRLMALRQTLLVGCRVGGQELVGDSSNMTTGPYRPG